MNMNPPVRDEHDLGGWVGMLECEGRVRHQLPIALINCSRKGAMRCSEFISTVDCLISNQFEVQCLQIQDNVMECVELMEREHSGKQGTHQVGARARAKLCW
jgi:hypothetical protein